MTGLDPGGHLDPLFDPGLLDHHGDAEVAGLLDFAVNVAVPRPPDFVLAALQGALTGLAAYPDAAPATQRLAEHLGVPQERVLLTNGAAEAFHLIARARDWSHPVVVHPQFTEPDTALRAAGRAPSWHVLPPPFALDVAQIARLETELPGADLVVVGNPTNPTSRLHAAGDLLSLRREGRVVLVDEAFMDVVPREQDTLIRHAASGNGVVVIRSLTKTFGLAGLRAGFLVGDPDVLADCRRVQPHWSVNGLALAATSAIATESGVAHTRSVTDAVTRRRRHLLDGLRHRGFETVEPAASAFVLVRHADAADLRRALRSQGIAVRRADTFPGLSPEWLRIAVRDEATTDVLLAALDHLTSTSGGHR